MTRAALLLVLASSLVVPTGCGSSSGGSQTFTVRIQEDGFFPPTLTVKPGDSIQWVNADSQPHRVVSGTLLKTLTPQTLTPISIRPDDTYVPPDLEANFGDTPRWRNDRSAHFILDIVDNVDTPVASLDLDPGQTVPDPGAQLFATAGRYTFQQRNLPTFSGMLTLFGTPNPNSLFDSGDLGTGGTFRLTFNSTGTFTYFDQNPTDPSRSFMTGVITVQ